MNEESKDQQTPEEDATRREFLKKLTYVAPLMITFQMDDEAEAQKSSKGKSKSKVSPTTKTKKKKGNAKKSG
jgi:hypothetical protein